LGGGQPDSIMRKTEAAMPQGIVSPEQATR
jgi:hypothetical protein